MGVARRIAELYEIKVNALLDRAEDPREMLDYSYARQQELLRRMRGAVADVAASRRRTEAQEAELRRSADRLQAQAEQAVAAGKLDLGRQALRLRAATLAHADDLRLVRDGLRADEDRLSEAVARLQHKIEDLRLRKEAMKASYTAAEAAAGNVAAGWMTGDMSEVDEAARRAEDKTALLQARADALDGLLNSGVTTEAWSRADARRIQEELDAVTTQAVVEEELARIRERLAHADDVRPREAQPNQGPTSSADGTSGSDQPDDRRSA